MPNWCNNSLQLTAASKTEADELGTFILTYNDGATFDKEKTFFGYFVPETWHEDDWYMSRVNRWGTKWDAYSMEIDDTDMPHGFQATFETAWSPPEEICSAIREQFDDLSMSWFYDEPGCEIAGYL